MMEVTPPIFEAPPTHPTTANANLVPNIIPDGEKRAVHLWATTPPIPSRVKAKAAGLAPPPVDQTAVNMKLYLSILEKGLEETYREWGRNPFLSGITAPETGNLMQPQVVGKKKVIIIGAGMAGLVAAHELLRTGKFQIEMLESTQRVGGRIFTVRSFSEGQYGEGGAMRFPAPDIHPLTWWYINLFKLETTTFSNQTVGYFIQNTHYSNAIPHDAITERFAGYSFNVSPGTLLGLIVQELCEAFPQPTDDRTQLDQAWRDFIKKYDHYSLRRFLAGLTKAMGPLRDEADQTLQENFRNWNSAEIDALGVIEAIESLLDTSFIEVFREFAGQWWAQDMFKIVGGNDNLPRRLLKELMTHHPSDFKLHFSAHVKSIQHHPEVKVHYDTPFAQSRPMDGDFVILTAPLSAVRLMEIHPPLSYRKDRAVRNIHYASSTKLFLEMSDRFWERPSFQNVGPHPSLGGATKTDRPIRSLFYPDNYPNHVDRILLLSYTWEKDANVFGGGADGAQTAFKVGIRDLQKIFDDQEDEIPKMVVNSARVAWGETPWTLGGFAYWNPGQYEDLWEGLMANEQHQGKTRLVLAGEATSHSHGWVQGAIESALRSVYLVFDQYLVSSNLLTDDSQA